MLLTQVQKAEKNIVPVSVTWDFVGGNKGATGTATK